VGWRIILALTDCICIPVIFDNSVADHLAAAGFRSELGA
jgi:hypothetical protein